MKIMLDKTKIITYICSMKNEPYIKEYNQTGNVSNPIEVAYYNSFPNRKQRRAERFPKRFYGNGKNFHLSVTANSKYKRVLQHETEKDGSPKIIEHYIL